MNIGTEIEKSLRECGMAEDFAPAAMALLKTLGYESERFAELPESPKEFIKTAKGKTDTKGAEDFIRAVKSVRVLFKFGKSDIKEAQKAQKGHNQAQSQLPMGFGGMVDSESKFDRFYFFAVDLNLSSNDYRRGEYAAYTREINKLFNAPCVVLFRCDSGKERRVTLSFVWRRQNKRDAVRHVLGRVSLLREIKCDPPHRGHSDILEELTLTKRLEWMTQNGKSGFDGLLAAWLYELDAEALNNRFYKELREWFDRAVKEVRFPRADTAEKKTEHVIRLLSRILFIWFIKEKGLVKEELFVRKSAMDLLTDDARQGGDNYYRAILQNLFFATLNTKIEERGFRQPDETPNPNFPQHKNYGSHRIFQYRRYEEMLSQPDALETWLDKSPFVNGGLFECLDPQESGNNRVDCFTDDEDMRGQLSVPDALFFNETRDKRGLFDILDKYKFTVEENTPIEQEVALDPELLGKVFENLLVYVERKQTGSYYTPRVVVDYMLGESLFAYFCRVMPKTNKIALRNLLTEEIDYAQTKEQLNSDEIRQFIEAADNLRLLDPAVGSGAFPMGALVKLTMTLRRIDPKNQYLRECKERIEINFSEKNQYNNYARKLLLIQKNIFGVDIQTIAVQICRLRFFISLMIEQDVDVEAENYGIEPLPNLETKIVAANTLIKITDSELSRSVPAVKKLEKEIKNIRGNFFNATDRETKNRLRKQDKKKRQELAVLLKQLSFPSDDADKIAAWDLYVLDESADWFDASRMFGEEKGFDVVIGNPPYVDSETMVKADNSYRERVKSQHTVTHGNWDLFIPFIETGMRLAHNKILSFIVPNKLLSAPYAKYAREFLANRDVVEVRDYSHLDVFAAAVYPITFLVTGFRNPNATASMTRMKSLIEVDRTAEVSVQNLSGQSDWAVYFSPESQVGFLNRLNKIGQHFEGQFLNPASVSDAYRIKDWVVDRKDLSDSKKLINSGGIDPFLSKWGIRPTRYIKDSYQYPRVKNLDIALLSPRRTVQSNSPKVIFANMTRWGLESFLDINGDYLAGKSTVIYMSSIRDMKLVTAITNSKLISFWYCRTYHAATMGEGLSVTTINLRRMPIPEISDDNREIAERIGDLAADALAAKAADADADITETKLKIDELVYELYRLSPEEIAIVEENQ